MRLKTYYGCLRVQATTYLEPPNYPITSGLKSGLASTMEAKVLDPKSLAPSSNPGQNILRFTFLTIIDKTEGDVQQCFSDVSPC